MISSKLGRFKRVRRSFTTDRIQAHPQQELAGAIAGNDRWGTIPPGLSIFFTLFTQVLLTWS